MLLRKVGSDKHKYDVYEIKKKCSKVRRGGAVVCDYKNNFILYIYRPHMNNNIIAQLSIHYHYEVAAVLKKWGGGCNKLGSKWKIFKLR